MDVYKDRNNSTAPPDGRRETIRKKEKKSSFLNHAGKRARGTGTVSHLPDYFGCIYLYLLVPSWRGRERLKSLARTNTFDFADFVSKSKELIFVKTQFATRRDYRMVFQFLEH